MIAILSTWEAVALLTGLVPTITSTSRRLPDRVRRGVAFAGAVWLIRHLW